MTNTTIVRVWREDIVIPTYECGEYEKNPIFLEKRVYQGSSGVVYPYPVIEKISDQKTDHLYHAVWMENEYIKVMILPELGGRVQMAYDKLRQRHFVYYNSVVKPALVGLAGPWISGGIEFNWPQHHRPSTFMEVDCTTEEHADGSVTIWINEHERMFGQKGLASFTLRPGCAYLEINGRVSNQTPLPQTFLWWANPAVKVNDEYRSVFPPDINAVFDHGKRAVSSFPIATGTYYNMDYSAGVDIANYKNIKVPTSYMGVNSRYNFEGGYEQDTQAGMLHVASHHFSPGKKQWTWGNGDFGQAWDRNLTDTDGPYIELMAGVYTENQPDFTWLRPFEEKRFTQYFMPYCQLPDVKNASRDLVMDVEPNSDGSQQVLVYATSHRDVQLVCGSFSQLLHVSPGAVVTANIPAASASAPVQLLDTAEHPLNGRVLLSYEPEPDEVRPLPDAAEAALSPAQTQTVEQLYLTALHLEQYRHATWSPVDYYQEALRREPNDVRCNNAMGLWLIRKGRFTEALPYLERAVKVLQKRNPNPYDSEAIYNLGIAYYYLGNYTHAYKYLWKASWDAAWARPAYLYCALISMSDQRYLDAIDEAKRCLSHGTFSHRAYAILATALRLTGQDNSGIIAEALSQDRFNYGCLYEQYLATGNELLLDEMKRKMRRGDFNYDALALHYQAMGLDDEAQAIWALARQQGAWSKVTRFLAKSPLPYPTGGEERCPFFPNRLEDIAALRRSAEQDGNAQAAYLLGCLYYDKRQYDLAQYYWQLSAERDAQQPAVWRCLALYYYNKEGDATRAIEYMERAFNLDTTDARILMELDQLYKVTLRQHTQRLALLQQYPALISQRDDLVLEEITLLNQTGQYRQAMQKLDAHQFHPWEGGEGKVPAQYQFARIELAKQLIAEGTEPALDEALKLLCQALEYPHHLGEGKLYGAQENDVFYLLGLVYEKRGKHAEACFCWQQGTVGPTEPAAAMYYNDAKPDKIFYAGLCYARLGQQDKANGLFYRLINFGEKHIFDQVKMDYFAVSLPDLLIWESDLQQANTIHCKFMMALGYYGIGNMAKAERYIHEAQALNINHQAIQAFLSL